MARVRKIDPRIWDDERFRHLSPLKPSGQALWLYLLTGPHNAAIPGLCRASRASMLDDLGWDEHDFTGAWTEIEQLELAKADWNARVLWMPRMIWYNRPDSPEAIAGWADDWRKIPDCAIKAQAWASLKATLSSFGQDYVNAFAQACPIERSWIVSASALASARRTDEAAPDTQTEPKARPEQAPIHKDTVTRSLFGDDLPATPFDETQAVKDLYNALLGDVLPRVLRGTHVNRHISARWKEVMQSLPPAMRTPDRALEVFRRLFEIVRKTSFLLGDNNFGWKADLTWLMRPTNFERVLQGVYRTRKDTSITARSEKFSRFIANYPIQVRIAEAHRLWVELGVDGNDLLYERIMRCLEGRKSSKEWLRGGGRYIPSPDRFLADRLWEIHSHHEGRDDDDILEIAGF